VTTYYIAPTTHPTTPGNDTTGNGSEATPWATISKAHTSAASGDTIICKDGTYTFGSQTFNKSLTIRAQNSGLAIFDGAAGNVSWTIGAVTLSVYGLIFQNITRAGADNYIFTSGASVAIVLFENCQFKTLLIEGAMFASGGIFGIGVNTGGSSAWTFVSCLFNDPHQSNTSNQQIFSSVDPLADDIVSLTLINCVLYLSTTGGPAMSYIIMTQYPGRVVLTLKNNIIYNGTGTGKPVTATTNSGSFTITANNNTFYNTVGNPSGTGNITDDPLFYDAAAGNFELRQDSPCLNTGTLV